MKLSWEIQSPQSDIPPHSEFNSLEELKQFLTANGVSTLNDRGWTVREFNDGAEIAQCDVAILVTDRAASAKTVFELTVSDD